MRKLSLILILAILSINLASALSCGEVVTESITLTEDLVCSETAITIDADNVVIDGNGYTIQGDGTGYGISAMENSGIVIKNLKIRNFEEGIGFIDDIIDSEVYNNLIEGNTNGLSIIVFGIGNKIHDNEFRGNERGMFISIFSNGNEIYDNKFIHNSDAGVRIMQSRLNVFYENNFIENAKHVDDLSYDNEYDNGVIGNYWDDFQSNSGFPSQYIVNGDSIDHFPFWFQAKCGDLNNDKVLDIFDLTILTNYVFRNSDPPVPIWAADINGDLTFDILDVTHLTNHVFRNAKEPTCKLNSPTQTKKNKLIA